ncbi:hypothetical protein O181_008566 [Austropuccinia psidii MF-1]|uniref:Uncharacterized protein n=1 Tax=Austropuccinia psidii MF-1 TaxID=1389203 RepID=A0A9Q3GIM8_9BASI|nr:hypothetical protein [Austropuccinia psidii MF-1]
MPFQHSLPARQTRSQASSQAVLTSTPRAPLHGTPTVPQLRAHLQRGPVMEGRKEENLADKAHSQGYLVLLQVLQGPLPKAAPTPVGDSQGTGGTTLSKSNKPVSHQYKPFLLVIMQQMTHIMANLQEASSSEASRSPAFKPRSMKTPDCFDETQPFKVKSFIQSCQLVFHNDWENFSEDRKKVLYSTSFLIGRAEK